MDLFPVDPVVGVERPGRGCNLAALFTPHWHANAELGFRDLRTLDDVDVTHRAWVRWRGPVEVESIRFAWRPGHAATDFRVWVERGADRTLLHEFAGEGAALSWELPVGAAIQGVVFEQSPGGGSASHPGVMRLDGVAIIAEAQPPLLVSPVLGDGRVIIPHMPLATDANRWTCLDLSDVPAVELRAPALCEVRTLRLTLVRLGGVCAPGLVRRWLETLSGVDVERAQPGQWERARVRGAWMDASEAGVAAGVVRVAIALDPEVSASAIRLQTPTARGTIIAAAHAELSDAPIDGEGWVPQGPEPSQGGTGVQKVFRGRCRRSGRVFERVEASPGASAPAATRPTGPPALTLDAARRLSAPLRYSSALGLPGHDARAGVDPQGGVMIRSASAPHADSHAQCLHLRARLDRAPSSPLTRQPVEGTTALRLSRRHGPLILTEHIFVAPSAGGSALQWWFELENCAEAPVAVTLDFGAALRDYLWALPLRLDVEEGSEGLVLRWPDGAVALQALGQWSVCAPDDPRQEWTLEAALELSGGQTLRVAVACPLEPTEVRPLDGHQGPGQGLESLRAVTRDFLSQRVVCGLPDPEWGMILERLLVQSTLFALSEDRVEYGVYPSVYHADTFGLEEDWLFNAWALFGMSDQAMSSFCATYLNPAHLSKSHYLHDLRNGLTPWQLERLLRLGARGWDTLAEADRALVGSLGRWTLEQTRVAPEEEPPVDGRPGVFPGLLSPYRYGGDLSFETQSLSANIANCVGLRALGDGGFGEGWADAARAYRETILGVFEAVKKPWGDGGFFYPMDTGGGDPGSYYQLFAAGIVAPLDFFATDDPRAAAMDRALEEQDRLFAGLPRFDDWGHPDRGVDAHYCVGYLLRALHTDRREVFWEGLCALMAHASDPEVGTFREVSPLQTGPPALGHEATLPGRRMSRSEPCVGGVGVALMLLRHAIVSECPEVDGRLGTRLSLLAGVPPSWWDGGGRLELVDAPTFAGPVSLSVEAMGDGALVRLDVSGAQEVELWLPVPTHTEVEMVEICGAPRDVGADLRVCLPPGVHVLKIVYR